MTDGTQEQGIESIAPEAQNDKKFKIVSSKEIKLAISEVLLYRDRYMNATGKRNMRDNIEPQAFATWLEIINAFRPTMEIGFFKPNSGNKVEDVVWYPATEELPKGLQAAGERHTDKEVAFTEQQVKFIEACYADRKDLQGFKEYKLLGGWLYDTVKEAGQ